MILLYTKTGCPFCHHVLAAADALGDTVEERNIANEMYREELMETGGKPQVPFLIDQEKGVSMYESSDIIAYLQKEYNISEDHDKSDHGPVGVCPI